MILVSESFCLNLVYKKLISHYYITRSDNSSLFNMSTKVEVQHIHKPLSFWFPKDSTKNNRVWQQAPDGPKVEKLFERYDQLGYEELKQLEKLWMNCLSYVSKGSEMMCMYPSIYDNNKQLKDITKRKFEASIKEVPEIKLYYEQITDLLKDDRLDSKKNKYETFCYEDYKGLEKIYVENEQIDDATFIDLCSGEYLCHDWSKMDENGELGKGYWAYPEDTEEYKNAFDLMRKLNIKKLMDLPYPRRLVLKSTDIGCANYSECVRYSEFVCKFVKTMYEILTASEN